VSNIYEECVGQIDSYSKNNCNDKSLSHRHISPDKDNALTW